MLQSRIFGVIWIIFSIVFFIFEDSYLGLILLILNVVLTSLLIFNIIILKNKLTFELKTEGTVHKNEVGRLTIQVENKSLLPVSKIKLHIQFENKLTNELDTKIFFISLNRRSKELVPLDLSSKYCGQIRVTVNKVQYYDFLGIFTKEIDVNSLSQLFVLPKRYPMSVTVADSNVGFTDSYSHEINRRGDDGLEIFGIKEYSKEDSLKHVHWKLTSKFDELIVKELSEAVNYTFLVLLDLSVVNQTKKNSPSVIDAMIDTFISISEALLEEGYEHSIGWYDKGSDFVQVEEVYSNDQLTLLLKRILLLEQTETKISLLDKFIHSNMEEHFSHVVYLNSEKSLQTKVTDIVQTKVTELTCYSERKQRNLSNQLIYTPETMNDDLRELSI